MINRAMKELRKISQEMRQKAESRKSIASVWIHNIKGPLYPIACKMAGVEFMSDDQILPTIFGGEDLSILDVVRNEFSFWIVAAEYAIQKHSGKGLERAISKVRADNTRAFTPRLEVLTGDPIKASDLVLLTAIGCVLYDFGSQSYEPNPLWYSKREWAEYLGRQGEGAKPSKIS